MAERNFCKFYLFGANFFFLPKIFILSGCKFAATCGYVCPHSWATRVSPSETRRISLLGNRFFLNKKSASLSQATNSLASVSLRLSAVSFKNCVFERAIMFSKSHIRCLSRRPRVCDCYQQNSALIKNSLLNKKNLRVCGCY